MTVSRDALALIEAHLAGVWRYLRFLGCDAAEADDLTQETFLKALSTEFEDRDPRSTSAWLRTVARNFFLMKARARKRERELDGIDIADAAWVEAGYDDDAGEARLSALRGCLEQLQGRARQALELQYRERLAGDEIARRLSLTIENLRVVVHRARAALKQCIERKLGGAP